MSAINPKSIPSTSGEQQDGKMEGESSHRTEVFDAEAVISTLEEQQDDKIQEPSLMTEPFKLEPTPSTSGEQQDGNIQEETFHTFKTEPVNSEGAASTSEGDQQYSQIDEETLHGKQPVNPEAGLVSDGAHQYSRIEDSSLTNEPVPEMSGNTIPSDIGPIPLTLSHAQPLIPHDYEAGAQEPSLEPQVETLPKKRRGRPSKTPEERKEQRRLYEIKRREKGEKKKTIKLDVDIHNRLCELKMRLRVDSFRDILFILLESFELTMMTSEDSAAMIKQEPGTEPRAINEVGTEPGTEPRATTEIETGAQSEMRDFVDLPITQTALGETWKQDDSQDHTLSENTESSQIGSVCAASATTPISKYKHQKKSKDSVEYEPSASVSKKIKLQKVKCERTRTEEIMDEIRERAMQRDKSKQQDMPIIKTEPGDDEVDEMERNEEEEEEDFDYDLWEDDEPSAEDDPFGADYDPSADYDPAEDFNSDDSDYKPHSKKKDSQKKTTIPKITLKKADGKKTSAKKTTQHKAEKKEKKPKQPVVPTVNWRLLPSKLKCRVCNVMCTELIEMRQHILEVHSQQTVPKPKCQKDQLVKAKMMGEVDPSLTISDIEVSKLSKVVRLCPYCNEYIPEIYPLIGKHMDSHAPKNTICELCGEGFKNTNKLQNHQRACKTRADAKNKVKCPICSKLLSSKMVMHNHVRLTHTEKGKRYICEICGKELRRGGTLSNHMATHFTVKPYECPECGKGFAQKSNMQYHRRVHTGEKPYKCDLCSEAFAHNVSLKTHKKKMHGIDMWATSDQTL
ncbi:uncharacterized protein [Amphiura filiformis]|uniref:uncharacterized protein isoform X2 n=1 Tax=Amphiura filiformis TaxID=82378 RepID=UPI003B215CC5